MTGPDAIEPEMLMAYADGELSPIAAKRVERAMATDPVIAAKVAEHRRLRSLLANHYAPVAQEQAPDTLVEMIRGTRPASTTVVSLASARDRKEADASAPVTAGWRRWGTGVALAASLALGLFIGQAGLVGGGSTPVTMRSGAMVASAGLARALDTQLADAQPASGDAVRVLATFRDQGGDVCRAFSGAALSGIACRSGDAWQLRETRAGHAGAADGGYRQAGSADAAMLADAQAMMAGDPFDAAAERKARAQGWR